MQRLSRPVKEHSKTVEPDITPAVYDGLGIGHGTAGRLLDGPEQFILADHYVPAHDDVLEQRPVFLHVGSGRRFTINVEEIPSDTPGDPLAAPEVQPVETPQSGVGAGAPSFAAPEPQDHPLPDPHAATPFPDILQPTPEEAATATLRTAEPADDEVIVPEGSRPSDPIAAPVHLPQPEKPQSNVPPDFELKVAERDKQLKPGVPIPPPNE